mmetsp:Transcript_2642/g.7478  ORF Transcript_2642/g.7478 Transcript_2642/m.7478 type:complete len:263 (-) Transcript_2642:146-934(-)|eukprot:CAMPEP_0117665982 /NCGR_PEP_ID=MMETSP0804-20121206/10116_1 /TAXON_ID=1074897 /ORGANISM="Tetraselmis astigmatica, Strain CCMP880" /LENGTH=262 /DNA_ID=CAMNT_0005473463 /DNA_START=179 /DNA_END=967 /DNA_ORIENTATION=-
MASVEKLFVCEKAMAAMEQREEVELVAGRGIVGDRYGEGGGTYAKFPEVGRQVTLISADGVEAAASAGGGLPGAPAVGDLRRNVVIRGMSAQELNQAVGCEIQLGPCRAFVHRLCVPCKYNERLNKCPGMMEQMWDVTGVNCEILQGGLLKVGDPVLVVAGSRDEGRINHDKPPEFFVRPSARKAARQEATNAVPDEIARKDGLRERRRLRGEHLHKGGNVVAESEGGGPGPAKIASPAFLALLAVMVVVFVGSIVMSHNAR